jgi:hypothetical protein
VSYRRAGVGMLLAVVATALLVQSCDAQGGQKTVQTLIQEVLDKKPAAALTARALGPSANQALIALTQHADPKVRRIAAYCLDETGGADAAAAFAELVRDDDAQVRGAALQGLAHHQAAVVPQSLLDAFDASGDPYVRQQLMLIAGRLPGVATADLRRRYDSEHNPEAKEGLVVALAGRGDPAAQAEFVRALGASRNRDRARYLDYAGAIAQPWLLPALVPILADKTPLVRIGVDGMPHLPENLRACDIAVNLIARITGHGFPFRIAGNVNYTDDQIAQVRALLQPPTAPAP